jgi:hypothetical protein
MGETLNLLEIQEHEQVTQLYDTVLNSESA